MGEGDGNVVRVILGTFYPQWHIRVKWPIEWPYLPIEAGGPARHRFCLASQLQFVTIWRHRALGVQKFVTARRPGPDIASGDVLRQIVGQWRHANLLIIWENPGFAGFDVAD